ncbi:hypothetical protein C2L65_06425 [Paraburkholderia terrae]|uniref:Uncharacterized protein n=2 Tax=Paraburkholderia terrae TaxID=311230 RepID=A0A2I8EII4_9BURK|nr:hypothetical protein C2L65_06425 [Paraburkholderia terrae]
MRRRLICLRFRWRPRFAFVLHASPFDLLAFSLASALCPSCFTRRRLICWRLRWHPRFAFVLHASPFDLLASSLASALCLRASRVAV